jgi:hypothetical protein
MVLCKGFVQLSKFFAIFENIAQRSITASEKLWQKIGYTKTTCSSRNDSFAFHFFFLCSLFHAKAMRQP